MAKRDKDKTPSLADKKPKARNDAYTIMLTVSLLAMIGSCVLLFYDLKKYGKDIVPSAQDKMPVQKQPATP